MSSTPHYQIPNLEFTGEDELDKLIHDIYIAIQNDLIEFVSFVVT